MQIGARFRVALFALLLAVQIALPACASAGPGFGAGFGFTKHHLPKVSVGVIGIPNVYDTRFGTNPTQTAIDGWFQFTPQAGVAIYYADSGALGNDSNNCTAPATPCATIDAAFTKFAADANRSGGHLRVAGTGGRTYTQSATGVNMFPLIGISATYPTVIESYDPADPTNAAKYGRLTGTNKPVIVIQGTRFGNPVDNGGNGGGNVAFMGLAFDGNDSQAADIGAWQSGHHDNLVWQNCLFNGISLTINGGEGVYDPTGAAFTQNVNISKSAFVGTWAQGGNVSPVYAHGISGLHVEDNVFWHSGWRVGGVRDDPSMLGGANGVNHAHYISASNHNVVIARNLYADTSYDGMNDRGDGVINSIASLDEPQGGYLGNFSGSYRERPEGFTVHFDDWLLLGGARINWQLGGGDGFWTTNTLPGSYLRNVAALDNPRLGFFVNSFNPYLYTPTSLTHSGSTATLSLAGHGFNTGDVINVYGASPAPYNVTNATVTVIDPNTLTYPMTSTPGTNATVVGQVSPLVAQALLIDKLHAYNYSGTLQGTVASTNNTWTNTIADQLAPGAGNATSTAGTFAGYKTRDQVVTAALTAVGITPGANYYARKGQLLNAALANPGGEPWAQLLIGVGFPAMGLTPTYSLPAHPTFTDTPLALYKTALTDLTISNASFARGSGGIGVLSGLGASSTITSTDLPAGFSLGNVDIASGGSATSGSNQLTFSTSTASITPGMYVTDNCGGFPYNSYIVSLSGSVATISQNSTATETCGALRIQGGGRTIRYDASGTGAATPTIHITETSSVDATVSHITALALNITSGAAFSPSSLSPDFWVEADPTKLYTDSGTTLVSADGDAIQQANDKSTAASNVTQTTLANKPLYKVGTSSKHYMHFDGSNDYLQSSLVTSWQDGTGAHWFAMSIKINSHSTGTGEHVIAKLVNGATVIGYIYYIDNEIGLNVDNTFLEGTGNTVDFTNGVPLVVIGTVTSTSAELFLNNVSPDGPTTLTGTRNSGSAHLIIGSNAGIGAADVDIYGIIHGHGTITSTDRANLQTYLSALHEFMPIGMVGPAGFAGGRRRRKKKAANDNREREAEAA